MSVSAALKQSLRRYKLNLLPIPCLSGHCTLLAIEEQGEAEVKIRYYDTAMEPNKICEGRVLQAGSHARGTVMRQKQQQGQLRSSGLRRRTSGRTSTGTKHSG